MMDALYNFFACALGQFAAYVYFSSRFELKRPRALGIVFPAAAAVQFALSFAGLAALNVTFMFACSLCTALIIYRINIKQALLHSALLEAFAAVSALAVLFAVPKIFGAPASESAASLLGISSGTLYFTFVYAVSKHRRGTFAYFVLLTALSLVCAAVIAGLAFSTGCNMFFALISVALPALTVAICLVHRKEVENFAEATESSLEIQRQRMNREYYAELEHQYDLRDILIHDMKGRLRTIKQLSQDGECERISSYVDSVYDSGAMGAVKQFSGNKLANVIISRYAHLCANSEVKFSCDVRSIDFSFLSDSDLTILLDNILHGAYKQAVRSDERFIDINIGSFNEVYVVLNVSNSTDGAPNIKKSERAERIGHIVEKYGGQVSFECPDGKIFTAKIMLKSPVSNIK